MITIKPRAFFFDFDGVIVDSEKIHMLAALRAAGGRGVTFSEEYYFEQLLGYDDVGMFEHLWRDEGKPLDRDTLKSLMRDKNRAFLDHVASRIIFFDGVSELVGELSRAAVPMAVVSGALKSEIDACLAQGELSRHFKFIVSADMVKASKPDPESYEKAWQDMLVHVPNLEKRDCWAIEDSPAGIHAAAEAGLNVIGITNSVPADQLKRADHVVKSVREIRIK